MSNQKFMSEVSKLRLMFQMNSRLRLESLAAMSKVFRDFEVSVSDELLASVILAVPDELVGYSNAPNGIGQGDHDLMSTSTNPAPPPPPPTPPPIPPSVLIANKSSKNKKVSAKRSRKS